MGPAMLSGSHLVVDPSFVEKVRRQRGKVFIEAAERRKNEIFCLRESDLLDLGFDGRVDIGVLELVNLEQLRFETEVFLRKRIMTLDGLHHGFDRFWCNLIGEMRRRRDVAVVAHFAIDLVVKKDIVENRS